MDKISYYNISIPYNSNILLYNTISNSLLLLTNSEYEIFQYYFNNLSEFETTYPKLYVGLKNAGFIISDYNELSFIKLRNNLKIYRDKITHITINPTLDCNLTCWYCSTEYANAIHQGRMSDNLVESVKKHISHLIVNQKIPALHLDWFGGEPLMYFNEVIKPISTHAKELCAEFGVRLTQHATTNSVFMTEDMLIEMNKLGLNSFQIPIDGNRIHHNTIKFNSDKTGTFDCIINNINRIPLFIPNAKIIMRINYDKKTLYGIDEIIPLISEQAKKHIHVDFQKVWQINCDEKDKLQLKNIKETFNNNGLFSNYWAFRPNQFFRCYADKLSHYAINYNGKVFKCTAQDYGDDKVIGILQDDGTIKWNYEYISALFEYATFENEKCLSCRALPICMGPCIIRNYEARSTGTEIPCVFNASQYSLESFIIDLAKKRGIISNLL